jgi:hypothetical protein
MTSKFSNTFPFVHKTSTKQQKQQYVTAPLLLIVTVHRNIVTKLHNNFIIQCPFLQEFVRKLTDEQRTCYIHTSTRSNNVLSRSIAIDYTSFSIQLNSANSAGTFSLYHSNCSKSIHFLINSEYVNEVIFNNPY